MASAKETVAAACDRVALPYTRLEAEGAEWPRMRRLRAVLAELPPESPVLDVGCGNGIPALAAIAERHQATRVDISPVQAERASENVPGARVEHGDIAEQEFSDGTFAAVVAFYVVEHLPRDEHAALFARFAGWLRPGGQLLLTTERTEEPGTVREWLGVPMHFSQFDEETTTDLLEAAGLEVVGRDTERQLEGDEEVEYVWFHARRKP